MFSDVFQSIRKTGLYFAGFHHPPYKNKFTSFFRNLLNDSDLQQTIEKLGYEDQAAVVELVYGDMDLHNVFLSKQQDSAATLQDKDLVPFLYGNPKHLMETISKVTQRKNEKQRKNDTQRKNETEERFYSAQVGYIMNPEYGKFNLRFPMTQKGKNVLHFMMQGYNKHLLFS
jgi:hypothetical protein